MAKDELQDHRIDNLETRVTKHGETLDELTASVAVLTESVQNTNVLLREALTGLKRAATAICGIVAAVFGAGQVM